MTNRLKVQLAKVQETTKLILSAEDAEEELSIDKKKFAEPADSQAKRWESMLEQTAKLEPEREKDQEAWDIKKIFQENSEMDSEKKMYI